MPYAAQGSHHNVTKLACRRGSWPRVHSLCQEVGCAASELLPLVLRLLLPPRLGLALDLVVAMPVVALVALVGGVAVGLQLHSVAAAGRATSRLPAVPVAADPPVQLLPYWSGERKRLGGGSL
jgi:hypothetical protein